MVLYSSRLASQDRVGRAVWYELILYRFLCLLYARGVLSPARFRRAVPLRFRATTYFYVPLIVPGCENLRQAVQQHGGHIIGDLELYEDTCLTEPPACTLKEWRAVQTLKFTQTARAANSLLALWSDSLALMNTIRGSPSRPCKAVLSCILFRVLQFSHDQRFIGKRLKSTLRINVKCFSRPDHRPVLKTQNVFHRS